MSNRHKNCRGLLIFCKDNLAKPLTSGTSQSVKSFFVHDNAKNYCYSYPNPVKQTGIVASGDCGQSLYLIK